MFIATVARFTLHLSMVEHSAVFHMSTVEHSQCVVLQ